MHFPCRVVPFLSMFCKNYELADVYMSLTFTCTGAWGLPSHSIPPCTRTLTLSLTIPFPTPSHSCRHLPLRNSSNFNCWHNASPFYIIALIFLSNLLASHIKLWYILISSDTQLVSVVVATSNPYACLTPRSFCWCPAPYRRHSTQQSCS